jgi:hypothetical protein
MHTNELFHAGMIPLCPIKHLRKHCPMGSCENCRVSDNDNSCRACHLAKIMMCVDVERFYARKYKKKSIDDIQDIQSMPHLSAMQSDQHQHHQQLQLQQLQQLQQQQMGMSGEGQGQELGSGPGMLDGMMLPQMSMPMSMSLGMSLGPSAPQGSLTLSAMHTLSHQLMPQGLSQHSLPSLGQQMPQSLSAMPPSSPPPQ